MLYKNEAKIRRFAGVIAFFVISRPEAWICRALAPCPRGGTGVWPPEIFWNLYAKWCIFLHSECIFPLIFFVNSRWIIVMVLFGENSQRPWYSTVAPCVSPQRGLGVLPLENFPNLNAKWCIFLHSERICSTEILFENLDEKPCYFREISY